MTACFIQGSGDIELYFYDELPAPERQALERHLETCRDCRQALEDLSLIRAALASRPRVDAPPAGDWSSFMARLEAGVATAQRPPRRSASPGQLLIAAALLALVTISVLLVARAQPPAREVRTVAEAVPSPTAPDQPSVRPAPALTTVGQQHLERSKLVLLGLAARDAEQTPPAEWHYERELASRLLDDTRLYRLAAEREGMAAMAAVMRDLEFVLLQTSLTEGRERSELSQIQRAISKRDLLHKMDVVRAGAE